MGHFGSRDKDWSCADIYPHPPEDLFECKGCDIEFSLESGKIKDKKIVCPICLKNLEAWQTNWQER